MILAIFYATLGVMAVTLGVVVKSLHVFSDHERGVVFRLGRVLGVKGPGVAWVLPIDRVVRVSLQSVAVEVPHEAAITRDSVTVGLSVVLYIQVADPVRALREVDDYRQAATHAAQTTLRNIVSCVELDELLFNRDKVNQELREGIDRVLGPYGVVVRLVELNDIQLTEGMRRAMAQDAEAERERRSKVIKAQGESEAADALNHAAEVMERHPAAMQLRILSALAEVAGTQGSTVIIPVPVELLRLVDRIAPAAATQPSR